MAPRHPVMMDPDAFPGSSRTIWEGVWGGVKGVKYLLRRYLEP